MSVPNLFISFKKSLNTLQVPCDWKFANDTPLLKKVNKPHSQNNCLISLTSVVGKLMDSAVSQGFAVNSTTNALKKLFSLSKRKSRGNLMLFCKNVKGFTNMNIEQNKCYKKQLIQI